MAELHHIVFRSQGGLNFKLNLIPLSIEEHKGDEIHKETYQSLSTLEQIDFVGNIEGKEI